MRPKPSLSLLKPSSHITFVMIPVDAQIFKYIITFLVSPFFVRRKCFVLLFFCILEISRKRKMNIRDSVNFNGITYLEPFFIYSKFEFEAAYFAEELIAWLWSPKMTFPVCICWDCRKISKDFLIRFWKAPLIQFRLITFIQRGVSWSFQIKLFLSVWTTLNMKWHLFGCCTSPAKSLFALKHSLSSTYVCMYIVAYLFKSWQYTKCWNPVHSNCCSVRLKVRGVYKLCNQ